MLSADVDRLAAAAALHDAPPDSGKAPAPRLQPTSRMTNGRETGSGVVSWCLQAYIKLKDHWFCTGQHANFHSLLAKSFVADNHLIFCHSPVWAFQQTCLESTFYCLQMSTTVSSDNQLSGANEVSHHLLL